MDERKTFEEIYEDIDAGTHLTFDFLCFTFCASCIAGGGLMLDSAVLVVAAMLVSPLMGPIIGCTLGKITLITLITTQQTFSYNPLINL